MGHWDVILPFMLSAAGFRVMRRFLASGVLDLATVLQDAWRGCCWGFCLCWCRLHFLLALLGILYCVSG